jgi:hypothetical protein
MQDALRFFFFFSSLILGQSSPLMAASKADFTSISILLFHSLLKIVEEQISRFVGG